MLKIFAPPCLSSFIQQEVPDSPEESPHLRLIGHDGDIVEKSLGAETVLLAGVREKGAPGYNCSLVLGSLWFIFRTVAAKLCKFWTNLIVTNTAFKAVELRFLEKLSIRYSNNFPNLFTMCI